MSDDDELYQNLVCSAAFDLGGLLGREWPGVDLDDGGVDWTMEAEDDLRSGEAPSDAWVRLGLRVKLGARVRVVGARLGFKSGFR